MTGRGAATAPPRKKKEDGRGRGVWRACVEAGRASRRPRRGTSGCERVRGCSPRSDQGADARSSPMRAYPVEQNGTYRCVITQRLALAVSRKRYRVSMKLIVQSYPHFWLGVSPIGQNGTCL